MLFLFLVSSLFQCIAFLGVGGGGHGSNDFLVQGAYSDWSWGGSGGKGFNRKSGLTVDPQKNKPLCNEIPSITNNIEGGGLNIGDTVFEENSQVALSMSSCLHFL